jgi:hypothetical protein
LWPFLMSWFVALLMQRQYFCFSLKKGLEWAIKKPLV